MHFCRVHLILLVVFDAWSSPSRARKGRGKEAHDRHASPSVRTCFFLLLFFLNRTSESSWSDFVTRERERAEERDERKKKNLMQDWDGGRRGMVKRKGRRGKREGRATEAGDAEPNRAGYRCIGRWLSGIRACSTLEEFCPLLLFFLFFFLFAAPFPFACARPPLVA